MKTINSLPASADVQARPWRWVTIIAGTILAATFFAPLTDMPLGMGVPGSGDANSPFIYWVKMVIHSQNNPQPPLTSLLAVNILLALFGITYIWGLCMAVFSYAQLRRRNRLRILAHVLGYVFGLFLAIGWGSILGVRLFGVWQTGGFFSLSWSHLALIGFLFLSVLVPAGHSLLALRRRPCTYLYHGFAAALVMVLVQWMTFVFIRPLSLVTYGFSVTSIAVIVLLIARVGEAKAITQQSWFTALWQLLTLRLHKGLPTAGQCPACRYNLFGLREQRCPECGRGFTFEELGVSPEQLGFAGAPAELAN